ncbi:MAG: T9SS type A sorting domain-containing protein [Bacteroidia bacterium]|nr:T9SS type A sorting domain-containing protein [Bacteroidia bacterium]MDW8015071.1 T9SS type A sorting domain-containing protein [Bacteroidia bacterium]
MRLIHLLLRSGLMIAWAQDTIKATSSLRGDFVEVRVEWRSEEGLIPLGANFVLHGSPASAIGWQTPEISESGNWSSPVSSLYFPLYVTAKQEGIDGVRLSLNLLANTPPAGLPFSGEWEVVGTWRMPLLRFGDTLRFSWSMESGEIVLAPFQRARHRFVYVAPLPLFLCPTLPPLHIADRGTELAITDLSDFRPENLRIRWYRDGVLVHEGLTFTPLIGGAYYAEVEHVCGARRWTDTIQWRTTSKEDLVINGWRIYPNPTTGKVWIESPTSGEFQLRLYNATGKCLYIQEVRGEPHRAFILTFPPLPAGLYQIRILSSTEALTFPIAYVP